MRSQFLQSPKLSDLGRRGAKANTGYAVNGLAPETVADYQSETYSANGAPVQIADLLTFSRSGAAVAHGADGYLNQFADGAIRAPSYTLEDGAWVSGLTFETEARSNILDQSNIANWTVPPETVVTSGETGMDGAASGFKMADDNGGGGGSIRAYTYVVGFSTAAKHVYSWYFKEDQLQWMMANLVLFTTPPNTSTYFDGGNGVVGSTANGVEIGIQDAGNGWYRGFAAFTTDATDGAGRLDLWLADGDGDYVVARDGTSSMIFDRPQFEQGHLPSSHVATSGSPATRNAESLSIASGKWPSSATAMSGALVGAETFADEDTADQVLLVDIRADANNRITLSIDTDGAKTGTLTLTVVNAGSSVTVSASAELPPGLLTAFGVAWRVTATEINIALDGVAQTTVANSAGIPDLSSADVEFGGMGFRKQALFWGGDIGDPGLEEASAPGHFNIEVL